MSDLAVGTIVAKNYLAQARVLAGSFGEHHPDVPFFVLLTDEVDGYFEPTAEPFRLLPIAEVVRDASCLRLRHGRMELAAAAKPHLLLHLLDRGFVRAIFIDPDVLVVNSLERLFAEVRRHAIVLTPHLVAPLTDQQRIARELNILLSGVFNGGLVGVADTPGTRHFLRWWQERVDEDCRHDVARGLYYDQRWLDLAPAFGDDVHVLRDPGYNVAHWNLLERPIRTDADGVLIDGRPCRFVHFSGFDPDQPDVVSRHSGRRMSDVGPAAALFRRYADLLRAAGYSETRMWPYAYERRDDARSVVDREGPDEHRADDRREALVEGIDTSPPAHVRRWLRRASARLWASASRAGRRP